MRLPVHCPCGAVFEAREDQAGGLVNCPRCGRATEVPGLRDPFWRLLQVLALLLVGGAGTLAGATAGPAAGVLAALGVAALLWLLSRAL